MRAKLIIFLILISNLCCAENIEFNPFTVFYPNLGDSICRGNAFNIVFDVFDEKLNKEQKIKEWQKYKKICSKDGSYQLILAGLNYVYEDYQEAEKILESCIKNTTFDTKHHKSELHTIYIKQRKELKATELAQLMIKEYPDFDEGYTALAANLINQHNWRSAKVFLEKAIYLNDQNFNTYNLMAVVSYELGEDDKMRIYYQKALSLNPLTIVADKHITMRMADVYIREKDFIAAKKLLGTLLDLNPSVKDDYRFVKLQKQCEDADTDLKSD